jgi:hypothetical protein
MIASELLCVEEDDPFCLRFREGGKARSGKDLGTFMFYHRVANDDPSCWVVDMKGETTWAAVTAITAVDKREPIRDVSVTACDNSFDSVFPSVYGKVIDVLLLSQSLDDPASQKAG